MKGAAQKVWQPFFVGKDAGKLLLDLGKLIFGSIFLGGVLRGKIPQLLLVIAGFTGAAVCCIVGLFLAAKEKNPD
jgi:hypothetical protein